MAEYCRDCSIRFLGPEAAKHAGGLCRRGETTEMLCEGCGGFVTVDHNGQAVEDRRMIDDKPDLEKGGY